METRKSNPDDAALRLAFTRMKEDKVRGDITALLNQIADAVADAVASKTSDDIRLFLMDRGE